MELNVLTLTGRYLQTKSVGTETAKQWEAGRSLRTRTFCELVGIRSARYRE